MNSYSDENQTDSLRPGERKQSTILFTDLTGFTALAEGMDPEDLDRLMNAVFRRFEQIVLKYGGSVEKYIGDAMVAVFGVPEVHEDDPARAIHTALEFRLETERLARKNKSEKLKFRSGIHAGLIATGKRGEYSVVTGDAMNVASRLQSAADPDTIYVSETIHDSCQDEFFFSAPSELSVKNRSKPLKAYRVLAKNSYPYNYDTPMIDRNEILNRLLKLYLKHPDDRLGGCILSGEAGVGKTRIAVRFLEKIREFPDFSAPVLVSRVRRFRRLPFAAINDMIVGFAGVDESEQNEKTIQSLQKRIPVSDQTAAEYQAFLAGNRTSEAQVIPILQEILETIVSGTSDAAYSGIFFIDNIHNMDASSISLLRYFVRNTPTQPFLLLTGRDLPPHFPDEFHQLQRIHVPALSRPDAITMVQNLWPEQESSEILTTILDNAAGNPLFIEEYVKYARYHNEKAGLPPTIQNLFLSAFEALPQPQQVILKKLSVFCQNFTRENAENLHRETGGEAQEIGPALESFLAEGILVKHGSSYAFRHDLFKKTVYGLILNHNKIILHSTISAHIKQDPSAKPYQLLFHLVRSESYEEAWEVLFEDPDYIINLEYLPILDILIDTLDPQNTRKRLQGLFTKSAILFNNGHSEDSEEVLGIIISEGIANQDPIYLGRAYHLLCGYNRISYSFEQAIFCGEKALHYLKTIDEHNSGQHNIRKLLADIALLKNDFTENQTLIELIPPKDDTPLDMHSLAVATRLLHSGDYHGCRTLLEGKFQNISHEQFFVWEACTSSLELLYWRQCDFEALGKLERQKTANPRGSYDNQTVSFAYMAACDGYAGVRDQAQTHITQAEHFLHHVKNQYFRIQTIAVFCEAACIAGFHQECRDIQQEGIRIGLKTSAYLPTFTLLILAAEQAWRHDQPKTALFWLSEAEFIYNKGVFLWNRDRIVYHFLLSQLAESSKTQEHEHAAADILEKELSNIGEQSCIDTFLSIRLFGTIAAHLKGETS